MKKLKSQNTHRQLLGPDSKEVSGFESMPHPQFETQWEEDSYWKHYDNYMESKAEYRASARAAKTAKAALISKKASQLKEKKAVKAAEEAGEWVTIGSKGRGSKLAHS